MSACFMTSLLELSAITSCGNVDQRQLLQEALLLCTHTTATPVTTTKIDATTGTVKRRFIQNSSTMHTNGMISNLAICKAR